MDVPESKGRQGKQVAPLGAVGQGTPPAAEQGATAPKTGQGATLPTDERASLPTDGQQRAYRMGMLSAVGCSTLWGILPIYWHLLRPIDSFAIIFYRIILVAILCLMAALKVYGWQEIRAQMRPRGVKLRYLVAGILITTNWSVYIWAVNANYVIQTCIGYYLEPLMVCLLGVTLFQEKMNRYKGAALGLAVLGVAVVIIHFRQVPMISLALAVTFSIYAAIKKNYTMPPLLSLLYETIFLVPVAAVALIFMESNGRGVLAVGEPAKFVLLLFSGLLTALPLMLFANAANKVSMFALGLTEYVSPTLSLGLSIFVFREPFDRIQLVAFAIIWIGLVIFSYGEYRQHKTEEDKDNANV